MTAIGLAPGNAPLPHTFRKADSHYRKDLQIEQILLSGNPANYTLLSSFDSYTASATGNGAARCLVTATATFYIPTAMFVGIYIEMYDAGGTYIPKTTEQDRHYSNFGGEFTLHCAVPIATFPDQSYSGFLYAKASGANCYLNGRATFSASELV